MWCVAGVREVYLLLKLNAGTQHSNHKNDSILRMGPRKPSLTQPLGNGMGGIREVTQSFSPFIVFTSLELNVN